MIIIENLVKALGGRVPGINLSSWPWIAAAMILAAVVCFLGYRLFRLFVALCGIGLGAVIGCLVGSRIDGGDVLTIILIVVFAAGICLVSFLIYKAGVFIASFFVFWSLAVCVLEKAKLPISPMLIALLFGLLMGILTVIFVKPLIITASGLGGGLAMAGILFGSVLHMSGFAVNVVILVTGVFFGALGMLVQFRVHGKKTGRRR